MIGKIREGFPEVFFAGPGGEKEHIYRSRVRGILMVIYCIYFIDRRMEVQRGYETCPRLSSE